LNYFWIGLCIFIAYTSISREEEKAVRGIRRRLLQAGKRSHIKTIKRHNILPISFFSIET
jgi:hypothetical protein